LAQTIVDQYRSVRNPEPICLIGHSYGSDDVIMIARELDKVDVPVDLIVTLDPVNERVVPKNVKLCYNYWQPGGMLSYGNFLRGIPLSQEPGSTGQLFNVNLLEDGRDLRDANTGHVNIDEAPKLHQAIIEHLLAVCPDRTTWASMQRDRKPLVRASDANTDRNTRPVSALK
jgi:thioesterase domain-containing protein